MTKFYSVSKNLEKKNIIPTIPIDGFYSRSSDMYIFLVLPVAFKNYSK